MLVRSVRFLAGMMLLIGAFAKAQTCFGVDQNLTVAKRALYEPMIATQSADEHGPPKVKLQSLMHVGDWTAVFALPANGERGVFFFQMKEGKPVYRDVWGGVSAGDSAKSIADWTKTIDASIPRTLAMCFGRAVVAGR